jgi:pyruvate dehydrogenase E1 component alpha subunit/2-oxoisovalerate dehydrogenase E1 component alpha subunit
MESTVKPSTSDETYTLSIPNGLELDRTSHLELYYFMALNRRLDERLGNLYRQNQVVGGLYSSLGQEACSVGSAYALQRGDFFAPMIRNLGGLLVRGVEPRQVMAQYCARALGPTGGKDLNVHFGWVERGIVSPISMLASLVPVFSGIALEMKMHNKKNVALTYVGDGATSTTDFHEGLNFAAVHKLPLILIIENNGWAYSTPVSMQFNVKDFIVRAQGYGCYGEIFDGNNVLAALDATRRARERCINGEGPVMLEAKTFRRKGHAEHDDAGYVPKEERAYWEKRDPLDAYRRFLDMHGIVESTDEIKEIDTRINQMLDVAVDEALASPFPDPSTLMENVYGD